MSDFDSLLEEMDAASGRATTMSGTKLTNTALVNEL